MKLPHVPSCQFLLQGTSSHTPECLEEGLQNNYSLRIVHNEEQISKNNATLGNAGYFPTLDFSAGYTGNLDNIESKARATGEITKNNGSMIRQSMSGLTSTGLFSTDSISVQRYKQLKAGTSGETNTRIAIERFHCGPDLGIL